MSVKSRIDVLVSVIRNTPNDDPERSNREIALVEGMITQCVQYINDVNKLEYAIQVNISQSSTPDYRDLIERLDKTRSLSHNNLISRITAVNRLCSRYNVPEIYQGGEPRREKGDFALELVSEYFVNRM